MTTTALSRPAPNGVAWGATMLYALLPVSVTASALIRDPRTYVGGDYVVVTEAARRWLAGDGFYEAWQLAGPYVRTDMPVLYPPTSLLLFAPASLLPAVLWWAVPLVVVCSAIIRLRPNRWAWPAIAVCLGSPQGLGLLVSGNPVMWAMAALALATVGPRWAAVGVLVKPSLIPFALFGARTRGWWVGVAVLAVVSLLLADVWAAYLAAMANWQDGGLTYSMLDVPLMAIPLIAWAARRPRRSP